MVAVFPTIKSATPNSQPRLVRNLSKHPVRTTLARGGDEWRLSCHHSTVPYP